VGPQHPIPFIYRPAGAKATEKEIPLAGSFPHPLGGT
jgi:hypothetical protein